MNFVYDKQNKKAICQENGMSFSLKGGRDAGDMKQGTVFFKGKAMTIFYFAFYVRILFERQNDKPISMLHMNRIIIHINGFFFDDVKSLLGINFERSMESPVIQIFCRDLKEGFIAAMRQDGQYDKYVECHQVEFMDQKEAYNYLKELKRENKYQ